MAAMFGFGFWEKMVMSSAYESMCTSGCVGSGMSCMKRLKRVGSQTRYRLSKVQSRVLLKRRNLVGFEIDSLPGSRKVSSKTSAWKTFVLVNIFIIKNTLAERCVSRTVF